MTDVAETIPPTRPPRSVVRLAYGQVAALLGAFSLLVFLSHFMDAGLKGVVRSAFDVWTEYVRPAVGYPLVSLIGLLPESYRVAVPDAVKDYFGVGIVAFLSGVRTLQFFKVSAENWNSLDAIKVLLQFLLLWPIAIPYWMIWLDTPDFRTRVEFIALWLTPLIYLGLLFAANAWLV